LGGTTFKLGGAMNQERAQAAWDRIAELGGHGVWEPDIIVISLAGAAVNDDDLTFLADLPFVQILSLSDNALTDACLVHLENLKSLESLVLTGTSISPNAIGQFRLRHPNVNVRDTPLPKETKNPWTGKPIG
jgi:hypothetical protein